MPSHGELVEPRYASLRGSSKMTIDALLGSAVGRYPDHPFVVDEERRFTYAEFDAEIDRAARGLMALGVKPGDRVALWMSNIWEWICTQFAVTRAGAVLCPLNTRLRTDDLSHILANSGASVVVTQPRSGDYSYIDTLAQIIQRGDLPALRHVVVARSAGPMTGSYVSWDDLIRKGKHHSQAPSPATDPALMAYILYTSGTTSYPKGVMLSHCNLNNAVNLATDLRQHDCIFLCFPLFAITGCHNAVLASLVVGGTIVLQERFEPEGALAQIQRNGCTVFAGIFYIIKEIVASPAFSPERVKSLRLANIFPRRPEHVPTLRRLGVQSVANGYGMTETCGPFTYGMGFAPEIVASEGYPWPDNELRIVGEDGRDQPPGEIGTIHVRGNQVMMGYFNRPDATSASLSEDGWFNTGDVGRVDENGLLTWVGRNSDIYKCTGFNVASLEVEEFLRQHSDIVEVAIAGVPDASKGEVGAAFVVTKSGAALSLAEIVAFCNGRIASYKIPGHAITLPSLPKTASGKIRKLELVDTYFKDRNK